MIYKVIDKYFEPLVLEIETFFNKSESRTIFQKRNIIKIINYKEEDYVVKSFKIPHILNQVIYRFFRDSKAKRSYVNSVKLKELGINTPQPIGYKEIYKNCLFKNSYYISEFFDYDYEIRAVLKSKEFANRDEILKEFIKFTYDLHNKGVYHIDYSPGNILVKQIDNKYSFFIIDVNRMQFIDFDNQLRMKAISKLTKDEEDNSLFLHEYAKLSSIDLDILEKYLKKYLEDEKKYLDKKKKLKSLRG